MRCGARTSVEIELRYALRASLIITVALLLAACDRGGRDDTASPTSEPTAPASSTATPAAAPLEWTDCDDGFECASLAVPLDYAAPSGATIDIALIRLPARDPSQRIGSLVTNPGGPGASGVEYARYLPSLLPGTLLERFDLVSFDPRGSGGRSPVDCGDNFDWLYDDDPTPDAPEERQALIDDARRYVDACRRLSGDLLRHVDSASAAHDMDRIRAALGDERLTYVGYSYGTYLGALYAGLFPERVRALVLDGGVDPSVRYPEVLVTQAIGFERALDAFFADCAADDGCAFHSDGDPASAYDALMAGIDARPIDAGRGRVLGPGEATLGVIALLYNREAGWPALARGIDAARDGDGSLLMRYFDLFVERDPDGSYSPFFEANTAIGCLDAPAPRDIQAYDSFYDQLRRDAPRIGAASSYLGLNCMLWPVEAVRQAAPIRATGAPPILVIGTTGDPATPYAWSQSLASQLESGVLLTYEGEGHTAFGGKSACVDDAVVAYLIELRAPAGVHC